MTTPESSTAGTPDPLGPSGTTAAPGAAAGAGTPLAGTNTATTGLTTGPATGPTTGQPTRRRGRTLGFGLAAALLVFVTVVLVLFVIFNTQTVQVSLVFGDVQAPLIIALVIAAGLGALLVGLAAAVLRGRRSRRSS